MTLLIDNWVDEVLALQSQGWVITDYSRYDPTIVNGLTPTGRVFSLNASGSTVSITVAGRTRTVNLAKAQWERADLTRTAMVAAWEQLPVNQR